ncbi:23S rRNA (cytidine(2498)-2'-O)-methyltransferase RlmM [Ketobacter sp. MCCC 1A13808]|uniref:23S rRNA (cytidine(2498)-2'-O)-methyltransferase RlmM n=1 Tax=Ketobacter sp. MCCC 1A13808 TaxID=2602738 RepID=UPI0012EC976C|nr:23S rRNA (cytidine(2498)-2'-O)-methyltransferase RlmM [Ketobacter sp. MCCC 1A13808]MVF12665.1 23S rRNA (cytidine(2498)-2'-O)-methyltransferase RlmM [Ketobacter sp. MCCC 1A13808]
MSKTLLLCRAGFESDLAAEIQEKAGLAGVAGFVRAKSDSGFVIFETVEGQADDILQKRVQFDSLVFARQWLRVIAHLSPLDPADRVTPIVDCFREGTPVRDFWLTFPDTNEGKSLSKLARKLELPLQKGAKGLLHSQSQDHAHLFLISGTEIWVGITSADNGSPWPLGFPRLRQPSAAPSRSTLKLEEAWLQLIPEAQRATLLKPFQKAVDLGAAPGGWTWQLVNRGMQVVAIDNGPMDATLLDSGQVTHLKEDAFSYRPSRTVDWLVCDMVDKPARVAELMERWLLEGWTRFAIFNLKLPMKRRWMEVNLILQRMQQELDAGGKRYRLSAKQLYHDREEITVFAAPA